MKGLKIILWMAAVIGCAVLGTGAWFAASILHDGLSARATPSRFEILLARKSRQLAIPTGARETANPLADSPELQRAARLHFADHCASCHANDGSGDTLVGRGLYPKPPDLRAEHTQKLSDGELFWIIENGVRFTGMPAFGGVPGHENGAGSWMLVRFIRHLPQLTRDERMEMEHYNPKGPDDGAEEQSEEDFLNGGSRQPASEKPHHH
jgi:mono/diheme cytochrome c family protein